MSTPSLSLNMFEYYNSTNTHVRLCSLLCFFIETHMRSKLRSSYWVPTNFGFKRKQKYIIQTPIYIAFHYIMWHSTAYSYRRLIIWFCFKSISVTFFSFKKNQLSDLQRSPEISNCFENVALNCFFGGWGFNLKRPFSVSTYSLVESSSRFSCHYDLSEIGTARGWGFYIISWNICS